MNEEKYIRGFLPEKLNEFIKVNNLSYEEFGDLVNKFYCSYLKETTPLLMPQYLKVYIPRWAKGTVVPSVAMQVLLKKFLDKHT